VSGGGVTASYAFVISCSTAIAPALEVRWGAQIFRLGRVTSVQCTNDPAVPTPPAGFDTQTGTGTGTLTTGGPGKVEWRFVDGGAGGTGDRSAITIRNASNAIVFQGSAAPPGKFPGSDQPTGFNTAR
jgi:hypothetical protein